MSGDLVPERRDLRASHEDRDQVVEQLRVAAGDGRLTGEELDERLESALTARTYGELERLLLDLPAVPGVAAAPKDLVQLRAQHGTIERVGPWAVPRRLEVEARGSNVVIDFTQAVITQPTLDLVLTARSSKLTLIVPPGVAVNADDVAVHSSNVKVLDDTGTPAKLLVTVSGGIRSSSLTVRGPRLDLGGRTFWQWLFRRPRRLA